MILLYDGFSFAVGIAVIILLTAALTAIWERLRPDGQSKKRQEKRRIDKH